jgi:hypothetical protein
MKVRLEATDHDDDRPSQRVRPGHDWFLAPEGRVLLWLGEGEIDVDRGEERHHALLTCRLTHSSMSA